MTLDGRVAIVTGASRGIGKGLALGLAAEGATVVCAARTVDPSEGLPGTIRETVAAIEDAGGTALAVRCDIGVADDIEALIATTAERFGRIDVLVNNAGGLVRRTPIADYTDEFVDQVLTLNVRQVVWFLTEVVPVMRRQGGGNIVNVSSIAARTGGGGGSYLYAGAKGFISTFSRALAKEVATEGIRVYVVSPGVIATDLQDRVTSPEQLRATALQIPMRRIGTPDECTGAFLYLCSDKLCGYVTGQVIEVNGGLLMP